MRAIRAGSITLASLRIDHTLSAAHHANRTGVVEGAGPQSPCPARRRRQSTDGLSQGSDQAGVGGSRICHADHRPAPAVLALAVGVVTPTLTALLIATVDLAAPSPPPLGPAGQAAVAMAPIARTADVEQPSASHVAAQALPQNDLPAAGPQPLLRPWTTRQWPWEASSRSVALLPLRRGCGPLLTPVAQRPGFSFCGKLSQERRPRLRRG